LALGQALKPHTFEKFSPHLWKNWRGKPKNFAVRRQSEARNFEMAQYIDKQITDVSSTIISYKMALDDGVRDQRTKYPKRRTVLVPVDFVGARA